VQSDQNDISTRWSKLATSKIASFALNLAALLVFLIAGLWIGPRVAPFYNGVFSQTAPTSGDFSSIYREAGSDVVMFSTSTCPHCREAREFFDKNSVSYRDYVIDRSVEAQKWFDSLGGDAVPVIYAANHRILGFDEPAIREALALSTNVDIHSRQN
jgi:glutaredoxin